MERLLLRSHGHSIVNVNVLITDPTTAGAWLVGTPSPHGHNPPAAPLPSVRRGPSPGPPHTRGPPAPPPPPPGPRGPPATPPPSDPHQGSGGGVKAPQSKAPPIPLHREPSPQYDSPPRQIPPPRRRWRSQGTPNPPRAISPIRFPPGKADTSSKEEVDESRHLQARHPIPREPSPLYASPPARQIPPRPPRQFPPPLPPSHLLGIRRGGISGFRS